MSPGLTALSSEVRSTPHVPNLGWDCPGQDGGTARQSAAHRTKAGRRDMRFSGWTGDRFRARVGGFCQAVAGFSTITPGVDILVIAVLVMATVTRLPGTSRLLSPRSAPRPACQADFDGGVRPRRRARWHRPAARPCPRKACGPAQPGQHRAAIMQGQGAILLVFRRVAAALTVPLTMQPAAFGKTALAGAAQASA